MLELKNISAGYGKTDVITDVSLRLEDGSLNVIIGPNGCGKSTLLKSVIGSVALTQGEVMLDGESLPRGAERAKRISYLPQGNLTPEMTVGDLVLQGRFPLLSFPRRYSKTDRAAAKSALEIMGLTGFSDRYMATLSGGMKQRAFIAMTLATESDYLLLDEPTAYLDVAGKLALMELLRELSSNGHTVAAVIHEVDIAMRYADRICVLDGGKAVFFGTPEELYSKGIIEKVFGVTLGRTEAEDGYCYFYGTKKGE